MALDFTDSFFITVAVSTAIGILALIIATTSAWGYIAELTEWRLK